MSQKELWKMEEQSRLKELEKKAQELFNGQEISPDKLDKRKGEENEKVLDLPGVYLWLTTKNNKVMYVGRTGKEERVTLRKRLQQHLHKNKEMLGQPIQKWLREKKNLEDSEKASNWMKDNLVIRAIPMRDPKNRMLLESYLIAKYAPEVNLCKSKEH